MGIMGLISPGFVLERWLKTSACSGNAVGIEGVYLIVGTVSENVRPAAAPFTFGIPGRIARLCTAYRAYR